MVRRLRSLLFILLAAGLGAVLGRLALDARKRMEAGESPAAIDPSKITLRVQDVVPGLVAAFRVKDAPWSWFHIPSWLAAFTVNLGVGALGGDLARFRAQAERTAFEFAGLDARDFGLGGDDESVDYTEGEFTVPPEAVHGDQAGPAAGMPPAPPSDGVPPGTASPAPWPAPPANPAPGA